MGRILLAAIMLLCSAAPAYAYLDPGTGSMIIQAAIGAIIGAGVAMKFYWHRFREFVSRHFKSSK